MAELCPKCGSPMTLGNCSTCGLPAELCVCATIERETQKIKVFVEKRKFNKPITIVQGITENGKEVASQLKSRLACGGTYKHNHIELQGDHRARLKDILKSLGYSADQIDIS